jgi:hypothetical protein
MLAYLKSFFDLRERVTFACDPNVQRCLPVETTHGNEAGPPGRWLEH